MSWMDRLKIGKRRFITHKVNGHDQNFYSLSPASLLRLRDLGIPISEAISRMITSWSGRDGNLEERSTQTDDGGFGAETIHYAATPEVMNVRYVHRTEAVDKLATSVLSPELERFCYELIMDSMRSVFERKTDGSPSDTWPTPEVFGETISVDDLYEMLEGVYLANKKVLSPLAGLLEAFKGMIQGSEQKTLLTDSETPTGKEPEGNTATEAKEE